jgi:hypothetical protein
VSWNTIRSSGEDPAVETSAPQALVLLGAAGFGLSLLGRPLRIAAPARPGAAGQELRTGATPAAQGD